MDLWKSGVAKTRVPRSGVSTAAVPHRSASRRARRCHRNPAVSVHSGRRALPQRRAPMRDRKSTRLNSSHVAISYAVFCLKKKKKKKKIKKYKKYKELNTERQTHK